MTIRFDDRVVVLTGACGSLGREYARAYFERGAKLVLSDLGAAMSGEANNKSAAEELAHKIDPSGVRAIADNSDLSVPTSGAAIVEKAIARFGRIDVLVHNAGNMRNHAFKRMSAEDYESVVNVHLLGAANLTRAAFPHLLEQKYGRILMVTSAGGLYGAFGVANYGAAKMAQIGLMNVLKIEGAPHNVHTNAIAPLAESRMAEGLFEDDPGDAVSPRWVSPVALYLTSENCARSGEIVVAAGRHYAKVQIVESEGIFAPAQNGYPTPEFIETHYDAISDMTNATTLDSLAAAIQKAVDVPLSI